MILKSFGLCVTSSASWTFAVAAIVLGQPRASSSASSSVKRSSSRSLL